MKNSKMVLLIVEIGIVVLRIRGQDKVVSTAGVFQRQCLRQKYYIKWLILEMNKTWIETQKMGGGQ